MNANDTKILSTRLDSARDQFGVITPAALHDQLATMTAADWRDAASIYQKKSPTDDGFYIDDTVGKVTIHNDMKKAEDVASKTAAQSTVQDAKDDLKLVGATTGFMTVGMAGASWVFAGTAAEIAGAAAFGAGVGLVVGGLAVGAMGGLDNAKNSTMLRPIFSPLRHFRLTPADN
jgi:hypothetical protein